MEINLNDIYNYVFGGRFVGYDYPVGLLSGNLSQLNPANNLPLRSVKPLRSQFTTDKNGYTYRLPVKFTRQVNGELQEFFLPNEPGIMIEGRKDIASTVINRGKKRGTVHEERNLADYRIRIQGICFNMDDEEDLPEEQLRGIRTYFEHPGPVNIENAITSIFGVTQVVITSIRPGRQVTTPINVMPYTMELISNEEFELEIE